MPLNFRMIGPPVVARQALKVHGRNYQALAGQVVTVPAADGERLQANGWIMVALSGSSGSRPTTRLGQYPAVASMLFWDETLGQFIVHDGVTWRDPTTGSAV